MTGKKQKRKIKKLTPPPATVKANVPTPQQSVQLPVQQNLDGIVSVFEVSPEVFEKLPCKEVREYGKKLYEVAVDSRDGKIDVGQLIEYERQKGKDPRSYLVLLEVAHQAPYLWDWTLDGKNIRGSKIKLRLDEKGVLLFWYGRYINEYGSQLQKDGPLEKTYRLFADIIEDDEKN